MVISNTLSFTLKVTKLQSSLVWKSASRKTEERKVRKKTYKPRKERKERKERKKIRSPWVCLHPLKA